MHICTYRRVPRRNVLAIAIGGTQACMSMLSRAIADSSIEHDLQLLSKLHVQLFQVNPNWSHGLWTNTTGASSAAWGPNFCGAGVCVGPARRRLVFPTLQVQLSSELGIVFFECFRSGSISLFPVGE